MKRLFILVLLSVVFPAYAVQGAVIHVPADQPTIWQGVTAANTGDTVLVANGTYTGYSNRLSFNGVPITILSESGAENCVIDCATDLSGGYFLNGETREYIVDGFTIVNGSQINNAGGGLQISSGSSPTIRNCIITNCYAQKGGGVSCAGDGTNPLFENCTITYNTAERGGGVLCDTSAAPVFYSCDISHNTSDNGSTTTDSGGGVFCYNHSTPQFQSCSVTYNSTNNRGGGMYAFDSAPEMQGCTIADNTADDLGGGLYAFNSSITVLDCLFEGNSATNRGGGACLTDASGSIQRCEFKTNSAPFGGGLYYTASSVSTPGPELVNCIIDQNVSSISGGGISCVDASPHITNCTIMDNTASASGGGVHCSESAGTCAPVLINCIVWDNSNGEIVVAAGSPAVTFCDVKGGFAGPDNKDCDPQVATDYRLTDASYPCVINAGTNTDAPDDDIDGDLRPMDGTVDIGADERAVTNTMTPTETPAITITPTPQPSNTPPPEPTDTPVPATPTRTPTPASTQEPWNVVINEIRIDQPGTDRDEYFELAGVPGTDLSGLTYLVIGDGTSSQGSGVIEQVTRLDLQSIPSDGYFLAAEDTCTLATPDFVTDLNFENSDNVTHLLVTGFTGYAGDDLDTDDDGTLDITPWTQIVDLIALIESENPPSGTEYHYGPPTVGPDNGQVPMHVHRCPDVTGSFVIAELTLGVNDTPGLENNCTEPTPTETQAPPTFTPTPSPIPPTATPTPTNVPPTVTPTPTAVPPSPTPTSPPCRNTGDVNFDGNVTSGDAQVAFQIALGIVTPSYEEECAADCNGDGTVTAGDAQQIFQTALGLNNCLDPV